MFFGAADLTASELYRCAVGACQDPTNSLIFWEIRLPRVLVGFLVGAGLAVAGSTLQNITRNGLADPYLFGVVSAPNPMGPASLVTFWINLIVPICLCFL